jgi:hypothetical protein
MRRILLALLLFLTGAAYAGAQSGLARSYKDACDSLSVLARERTGVEVKLQLKKVLRMENGGNDFYFSQTLGDLPWHEGDIEWLRSALESLAPASEKGRPAGRIFTNNISLNEFVTPELHGDGLPHDTKYRAEAPESVPLVSEIGARSYDKGLSGRHIALWQSHGRYYEENEDRWKWQRARGFMTVEDMYTQSYVIPFLIPMLENAGACVLTPRERDPQKYESVVDNDPAFGSPRTGLTRRSGEYAETGHWSDCGTGFADSKEIYSGNDNPFAMGTARKAAVHAHGGHESQAVWTPDIPVRGRYAVYISYKSLPNSTSHAHYTVVHMGGRTEFSVNQKMGGGTWICLGTFEFAPGQGGRVILDNRAPEGRQHGQNEVVTADAVRFGGGMGKIARGKTGTPVNDWSTSGMPAYMEGALYSMQWSGVDSTITRRHKGDYTNDFADRGPWAARLAGGSAVNPKEEGLGIPIDLSFAMHSDAGVYPNDSIVGTLSIYTLKCDGIRTYPGGGDRMAGREYCDYVQTQVVNDIRARYDTSWTRRETWDRSYSEARTSGVPGMILELLSHQNFSDMRYGLDPEFRFDVSRAVYKGMLKFLSNRYGRPYVVQPLPVAAFSAVVNGQDMVRLGWTARTDSLEATAIPKGFILYTRIDGGAFDSGHEIEASEKDGRFFTDVKVQPGHIYSFRIQAWNDGGRSFPSETLAAGIPSGSAAGRGVLIVNNFTRVSGPAWFDTPDYAGFDESLDGGVPYMDDISYIGPMYQFRRGLQWESDDNPGFGASYDDMAGFRRAGNSFDYPYVHGKAVMASGRGFSSVSAEALSLFPELAGDFGSIDLICGKQVTTVPGKSLKAQRHQVFPKGLRDALAGFASGGGNILVSGADIGTDIWDRVYPVVKDAADSAEAASFAEKVLGYRFVSNYACRSGELRTTGKSRNFKAVRPSFTYCGTPEEKIYCVETPDAIRPSDSKGGIFLKYADTGLPAGIWSRREGYRTVCLGVPLEVFRDEDDIRAVIGAALDFFEGKD